MHSPMLTQSSALVRYQDCDTFNHLNSAKYLHYMINAWEDQIATNFDIRIFDIARSQGGYWLINNHQIHYFEEANLMEKVLIDSRIIEYSDANIKVEIKMWDQNKKILKAVLWSDMRHINILTKKSKKHDKRIQSCLEKVCYPIEEYYFEERIQQLKNNVQVIN